MDYKGSGYSPTGGIYHSKLPKVSIPRNIDVTTFCLFQQTNSDKVCLIDADSGRKVTYEELKIRVQCVASGLAAKGVRQHDIVMICMPNSIHWPVLVFAVLQLGAVVVTANPVSTLPELNRQVKDSNPAFIVTTPQLWEKFLSLGRRVVLNDIDGLDDRLEFNGSPFARLSELLGADPSKVPHVKIKDTDLAALLYSSGTAGPSKGVMLTHQNIVETLSQRAGYNRGNSLEDTVLAVAIPLFHVMGLLVSLVHGIKSGASMVIFSKFDFVQFLDAIQRYKITMIGVVPAILVLIAKSPLVEEYDLSSLDHIGFGGAPAGDLASKISQRLPRARLSQGYGMTETCALGTAFPKDYPGASSKVTSCGILAPNLQAKIIDLSTGQALPPNCDGELLLRGSGMMTGYLHNKKATEETVDKDGWLHTGDVARFDDDGCLYIVDRLKELIKYRGYQVAPAELETLLLSHNEILDAAVVPRPDEAAGEVPVSFVVKRPGSLLTGEEVMKFVASQVSPYKRIRGVEFVSIIPRSAAGKILRQDLKRILTHKALL